MVDDRTVQHPAQPTGVVGASGAQRAGGGAVVGHDLVAGRVVRLHEDHVARSEGASPTTRRRWGGAGPRRHRERQTEGGGENQEQGGDASHWVPPECGVVIGCFVSKDTVTDGRRRVTPRAGCSRVTDSDPAGTDIDMHMCRAPTAEAPAVRSDGWRPTWSC